MVKFKEDGINVRNFYQAGAEKDEKPDRLDQLGNFASKYNLESQNLVPVGNFVGMKIKDGKTVEAKIKELEEDQNVEFAQPNFKYKLNEIDPDDDTEYANLWGLNNTGQTVSFADQIGNGTTINRNYTGTNDADMDVPEAWAVSEGNDSITVAVIDTGVAYDHPDLAANMWDGSSCVDENGNTIGGGCPHHGWDFDDDVRDGTSGDDDPSPGGYGLDDWGDIAYGYSSHGTHVAGIIAGADNDSGIIGIAPNTKIMALKTYGLTTDIIVKAIAFAENNGASIINASWGGESDDTILKDAIENFDGLFIVAAGNESSEGGSYPCDDDLDNIICVAATDNKDNLTTFSNYSATTVDVGAPGENILSSVGDYNYAYDNFESLTVPALPDYLTPSGGSNWSLKDVTGVDIGLGSNFGPAWGKVIAGDESNPYADDSSVILESDTINIADAKNADFSFETACDTQYDPDDWNDYMTLEASEDDGNSWTEIGRWDEATIRSYGGYTTDVRKGYVTGRYYNNSLDIKFHTDSFKYRFKWITDDADNNYGGCFIDNFWNTIYTNGATGYLSYYSGTSMATPYVVGLAALIWETNNNLTREQVKDLVLYTGDTLSSLKDKTLTRKRVNAFGAVSKLSDNEPPTVAKKGDGYSDYSVVAGKTLSLVFSEVVATNSREVIESAILDELENSGYEGIISDGEDEEDEDADVYSDVVFTWSATGKTLKIVSAGYDMIFNDDVSANVSDIVGNTAVSLLLIDSTDDETPPSGSIRINNGAAKTSNKYVTLNLSADDNSGMVYRMQFSNNGRFWSPWYAYATSRSNWNLTSAAYGGNSNGGTKKVYVKFMDRVGNISERYDDAIIYGR